MDLFALGDVWVTSQDCEPIVAQLAQQESGRSCYEFLSLFNVSGTHPELELVTSNWEQLRYVLVIHRHRPTVSRWVKPFSCVCQPKSVSSRLIFDHRFSRGDNGRCTKRLGYRVEWWTHIQPQRDRIADSTSDEEKHLWVFMSCEYRHGADYRETVLHRPI